MIVSGTRCQAPRHRKVVGHIGQVIDVQDDSIGRHTCHEGRDRSQSQVGTQSIPGKADDEKLGVRTLVIESSYAVIMVMGRGG